MHHYHNLDNSAIIRLESMPKRRYILFLLSILIVSQNNVLVVSFIEIFLISLYYEHKRHSINLWTHEQW